MVLVSHLPYPILQGLGVNTNTLPPMSINEDIPALIAEPVGVDRDFCFLSFEYQEGNCLLSLY